MPVDTAMYTILPYDSTTAISMNWHGKVVNPGQLTAEGVDSIESIIDNACQAYNDRSTSSFYKLLPLYKYHRQYIPVVTANGERLIWVNFFCWDILGKWREQIVSVNDGGNCFFNLYIDVNHRIAYDLSQNGYAFLPERFSTFL
jgi:hypothetical protein